MQVILLEKIANLGNLGDLVNVKPGFARNYLVPQGLATVATEDNIKIFEERRAELEKACLLYTSPSPRDLSTSRMPSSA